MEKQTIKPKSTLISEEEKLLKLEEQLSMDYKGKLHIPDEMIPPDVEYYFVRISTRGEPDSSRMVEMRRKGWTPVPASRHPELVFTDFFNSLDKYSDVIYSDGLLLCERSKRLGKIEQQRLEDKNLQVLTSMPGTENFLGEPSIPTNFTGNTYSSKGASNR